jgi:hypothetical protein
MDKKLPTLPLRLALQSLFLLLAVSLTGCTAMERHPALSISVAVIAAGMLSRDKEHHEVVFVKTPRVDCESKPEVCR